MKNKTARPLVLGLATALAATCCNSAPAANPGQPKPSALCSVAAPAIGKAGLASKAFAEIDFDNLPLQDVVEYLREHTRGTGVNFILSKELEDVAISLRLRDVSSFDLLLKAIEIAAEGKVAIEPIDGNLFHFHPGETRVAKPEPILRVFNLSRYLGDRNEIEAARAMDELHTTVELAFEMLAKARAVAGIHAPQARLPINSKFHPGTKLMIVIATADDLDVFAEVTGQLLGEPRRQSLSGAYGGGMEGGGADGFGEMDATSMMGGHLPARNPRPSQDPFAGPKKDR